MAEKELTEDQKKWVGIWENLDKVTALQKVVDIKFIEIVKCKDTDKAEQLTNELMLLIGE